MEENKYTDIIDPADLLSSYKKFTDYIPVFAKSIKVKNFTDFLDFTLPQYYRRCDNPSLWTIKELEKVLELMKKHNVRFVVSAEPQLSQKDKLEEFNGTTAEQLREMIKDLNINSKKLSQATGIGQASISRYLSGEPISHIAQIALFYFLKTHMLKAKLWTE